MIPSFTIQIRTQTQTFLCFDAAAIRAHYECVFFVVVHNKYIFYFTSLAHLNNIFAYQMKVNVCLIAKRSDKKKIILFNFNALFYE